MTENDLKVSEDHFDKNQPGPITNEENLLEEDKDQMNIYGTGTMKGYENEYIDRFVEPGIHVNQDYICINEELWQFLFERYGG